MTAVAPPTRSRRADTALSDARASAAAYGSIVAARFRALLQYRAAALAGLGTQLFWGLIRMMIFRGFYASSPGPHPMALDETITYIWLTQALLLLVLFRADTEVQGMIRNGTVVYELTRPLDLYWNWFCRGIAARTAPTLLRAVPLIAISAPFLGLALPPSPAATLTFALSLGCAVLLNSAITTIMNISNLWTVSGQGTSSLVPTLVYLFSGALVPLPLYPAWAQPLLNALPFRGLLDVPFRFWIGHLPAAEALPLLAHQIAWTAALILLGRWLLARGMRRLVVQGG